MRHAAWVLVRVQCGWEVKPEHLARARGLEGVGGILDGLSGAPIEERARLWHRISAVSPLADELAELAETINAQGPSPEEEADEEAGAGDEPAGEESDEGWGPLRLGEPPAVGRFPCDVFPRPLEAFCRLTAEAILAPVDYVGVAMLATAGTAVGQSVNLQVKRGWDEAPLLYAVIVGDPGRVKSPALRAATRPLMELDMRLRADSQRERARWEQEEADRARSGEGPPRGPEPPRRRVIVKDITRESLCLVLADNPRGVLCAPDEATAWVDSWNQYKSKGGNDEQFWLSLYSGEPVGVDRKGGRESIDVPHPFCAVVGSIQPDLLADLRDDRGRDNGFLDRIVFSYPEVFPERRWTETEVGEGCEGDWKRTIDRLHAVEMNPGDGRPTPWLARFTPEAKRRFVAWFNRNGQAMGQLDARPGSLSKAEARLARLALILSRLRLASDPRSTLLDPAGLGVPPVETEDVEGAVRLDAYFASHAERALHHMNRGTLHDPDARALLEWIRRCRRVEFKEKEAREDLKRFRVAPDALLKAIQSLSSSGLIRPKTRNQAAGTPGRKPSPAFDVHPSLHDSSTQAA